MVLEIVQKYLYENVIRYLNLLNVYDVTIWDTLILALCEFQKPFEWGKLYNILCGNNSSYKIIDCDELM
jgi:hypothetical protein